MYISKLIIKNYKSIKDETFIFNKGINVLVGKNNAGKSNIVSALNEILGDKYNTTSYEDKIFYSNEKDKIERNFKIVAEIDEIDDLDLEKLGPKFENDSIFPERVNTEFIKVIDENTLKMRVWERGSGETWACGTGACAAVVSSVLNGYCKYDTPIKIKLLGGELSIKFMKNGLVYMSGPAEFVFEGSIENE